MTVVAEPSIPSVLRERASLQGHEKAFTYLDYEQDWDGVVALAERLRSEGLEVDVAESNNLAEAHPERLREMIDLWWAEAERNQVLPLDNRILWALVNPKPDARRERERFRYFQDGAQVPEPVAVNVRNRSHALIVDITVPDEITPEGTLLAIGSGLGGWSLQFRAGRPRYIHNLYGKELHVIGSHDLVGAGSHTLEYEFTKDEGLGGLGVLRCDGIEVGRALIPRFTPSGFNAA